MARARVELHRQRRVRVPPVRHQGGPKRELPPFGCAVIAVVRPKNGHVRLQQPRRRRALKGERPQRRRKVRPRRERAPWPRRAAPFRARGRVDLFAARTAPLRVGLTPRGRHRRRRSGRRRRGGRGECVRRPRPNRHRQPDDDHPRRRTVGRARAQRVWQVCSSGRAQGARRRRSVPGVCGAAQDAVAELRSRQGLRRIGEGSPDCGRETGAERPGHRNEVPRHFLRGASKAAGRRSVGVRRVEVFRRAQARHRFLVSLPRRFARRKRSGNRLPAHEDEARASARAVRRRCHVPKARHT
mmetsp:Transcript_28461/g.97937  ORF Transcript_28461/g.97937 Transcript_28461/m.97937 type:complete len:299 (-) Transcript_28461:1016-1912(-)